MAFRINQRRPSPPTPQIQRITQFKGLNLSVASTQIEYNQSSDMLNMVLDDRETLDKRTGYKRIFETSLGTGAINGIFEYKQIDGDIKYILAHGTKLYEWFLDGTEPTEIHTGIADAKMRSFTFNNKLYLVNGIDFLLFDGANVENVEDNAYVPTLTIGRSPSGGGTFFEDFNLIGTGFKDSFDGDNSSTAYTLSLDNLDATEVIAVVDGVTLVENTDFTVDRTNGIVNFTSAPATGTNNVVITAHKTIAGFANRIKNCTFYAIYGGTNDTRVFLSGNSNFPNYDWRSGLFDPTYWPENSFDKVGADNESIKGYSVQYNSLIILKETTRWLRNFSLDSSGNPVFTTQILNYEIGCVSTDSIQLIENTPYNWTSKGCYALVGSNVRDERNVNHISDAIDKNKENDNGMLTENNLDTIVSIDYDKKYISCIPSSGNCYVLDYQYNAWYKWDNIYANCFIEIDDYLYFGDSRNGLVYKFSKVNDELPYRDDDVAINAYWRCKLFDFGTPERLKLIKQISYTLKPNAKTSATLKIRSNLNSEWREKKTIRVDWFTYSLLTYSQLTYGANTFPQEGIAKVKEKKVNYFQMEYSNNVLDESMGISSTEIIYLYQRLAK